MQHRIVDQIGQYLTQRTGVAVQHDVLRYSQGQMMALFEYRILQSTGDFLCGLRQMELSSLLAGLIGADLLKTGDQFTRIVQIAHQ